MAIVNQLFIVALIVVAIAFAANEFGGYATLSASIKRYRARMTESGLNSKTLLPLILTLILALMMHAPLISAYLILVGIVITVYFVQRTRRAQRLLAPRDVLQLILAFRSTYQLQPSVFSTLDQVKDKLVAPLKALVNVLVQTYYLTSSPERAFAELRRRTDNVYLNQFAYILEMSESATVDAVVKALDNLVERLRVHDELRRESEASLASINTQTAILRIIAIGILLAVGAYDRMRSVYAASLYGQLFYAVMLTVMLVASYYIDRETFKLMERIS